MEALAVTGSTDWTEKGAATGIQVLQVAVVATVLPAVPEEMVDPEESWWVPIHSPLLPDA